MLERTNLFYYFLRPLTKMATGCWPTTGRKRPPELTHVQNAESFQVLIFFHCSEQSQMVQRNFNRGKISILFFDFFLNPILRLQNLLLQRQRCSRLERFFNAKETFFFKTH
jgi:hypothetical protein